MVTLGEYLVNTNDSSIAESPPPTTITFLSLKKGASQGAQEETPLPLNLSSPGTPNHLISAPVAIMILLARNFEEFAIISKGFLLKSTFLTSASINSTPNL